MSEAIAAEATPDIYFNPWDEAFRANPYPHYRPLLAGPPRIIDLGFKFVLAARYADVRAILMDHATFSSVQPKGMGFDEQAQRVWRGADDARFRSADANAPAPAGLARLHAAPNPRARTAHPRDRKKSARRRRAQGPVRRDGGSRQSAASHGDQRFARRAARGIPAIQKLVGQDNRGRQHAPRDADPRRDQERLH